MANKRTLPLCTEVGVEEGRTVLPGMLRMPASPKGFVIFSHGSGSGRLSPRNQRVADVLFELGLGTLLFDLLTEEEAFDRANVFDIPLLTSRLVLATRWAQRLELGSGVPIGYFGASTGAASALWAAAELRHEISAVVSRGGRPDLVVSKLQRVSAPTLLIVGGNDEPVVEMNQEALRHLATANLVIIPDATHLFEETGALEQVSRAAASWFLRYLGERKLHEAA